jgi:hypothetical protein
VFIIYILDISIKEEIHKERITKGVPNKENEKPIGRR